MDLVRRISELNFRPHLQRIPLHVGRVFAPAPGSAPCLRARHRATQADTQLHPGNEQSARSSLHASYPAG